MVLTRKPKTKRRKQASLSTLRKKAWTLFSKHVRYEGEDPHSIYMTQCVTCGVVLPSAEMHAGHFIHCSKQSRLSYDERNVHPQCRQCNYYGMQGQAAIRYTMYMIDHYGPGIVAELLEIKHSKEYLKRDDLEEIIEKYSSLTSLSESV